MFDMMCEVVCVVDGKVVFEVLGGVNFEMVCMFVEMGVDCILIGVLMKDVWVIDYLMWIVDWLNIIWLDKKLLVCKC